jgi:fused signal recognition particle receptor
VIREQLLTVFPAEDRELRLAPSGPTVIMVAGVNGAGKTTSIAKLAWLLKTQMNKKVMVAASDTFRAAAVDQLTIWAERIGVEIVKHKMGADPAAVAYDACEAAKARGFDVLIVDTAGRLHTQENLMRELTKIRDVVARRIEGAPHEVLLVLDATTGQNAVLQAQNFGKAINVTGVVLAKLDGTAKGGVVIAIKDQLNIPVKFIGLGETPADIETFDPKRFIDALFGEREPAAAAAAV